MQFGARNAPADQQDGLSRVLLAGYRYRGMVDFQVRVYSSG
ncbi:MAG: hypothetical protein WDM77_15400 [Steroidobacteraceae bacterium]